MTKFWLCKYNDFYQKYKNTILFNKNLILSGIAAFFAGSIFTQLYAQPANSNNLLNAALLCLLSMECIFRYLPCYSI